MDDKVKTTIYIPSELVVQLKQLAKQNRRSFNSEILVALDNHVRKVARKPQEPTQE